MTWTDRAACKGRDTRIFFPVVGDSHNADEALTYCSRCPVTAECLADALEHRDSGVWGGTTGKQRRAMIAAEFQAARQRRYNDKKRVTP